MKTRFVFLVVSFVAIIAMSTPFVVRAQTADQLRLQIADILAQINTLRAQLQGNTATPTTPTNFVPVTPSAGGVPITPTVNSGNALATFQYSRCPDLQFNLERGDRDAHVAVEITMLQRFLAQDASLYPGREITGYFGPATERAVQLFQERHGIVARGDYKSTGYGRVGPRTRWAIKNSCGVGGTHTFTVSPTTGPAPLSASAAFEFRGLTCTSYRLDWGDGSAPLTYQATGDTACSQDSVRKGATHTYRTPGTYVATLYLGKGSIYSLPVIGRANIVVQGSVQTNTRASVAIAPSQGKPPLTVKALLEADSPSSCTSYEINWGDGSVPIRQDAHAFACTTGDTFRREFTHTYQNTGVYTLNARAGRGAINGLSVMTRSITVQSSVTGSTGCFISPTNGAAPLASQARILFGGTLCDGRLSYSVDWGDGNTTPARTCSDTNSHFEQFSHTYTNPGVYTARLNQSHPNARFEEQTCTVNVTRGSTTTNTSGIITNACRNWTDGCNTCSRSYVGGPAACTQRYCVQRGQAQCYQYFGNTNTGVTTNRDSLTYRVVNNNLRTVEFTALINAARQCNGGTYTIYFGDSQDSLQPYPADACQLFTRNVTHTYAQNGTYTALLLKNGVTVDQITVTVNGTTSSSAESNVASVISIIERFVRAIFK